MRVDVLTGSEGGDAAIRYRADIDGLRAIAIASVVLYHAQFPITGGFVGVDIFFVISGYLITSGILKSSDNGTFRLLDFYERRARRILPAMLATTTVVLFAGYVLLFPNDFSDLATSAMAQLAMSSNVYFWIDTGYFAAPAATKPLLHTWSLAIEEQFYLVLPIVLKIVFTRGRRFAFWVLVAAMSLSLTACGLMTSIMPSASFYLLPTRRWELLIGSLIAFAPKCQLRRRWVFEAAALLCLTVLLGSIGLIRQEMSFPGFIAIVPVFATGGLIWLDAEQPSKVGMWLSQRPVVGLGLISYSLYLWHWPILVFANYAFGSPSPLQAGLLILLSLVIASFSYRWIEQPIRGARSLRGYRLVRLAMLGILVPMSLAAAIRWTNGAAFRLDETGRAIFDQTHFKYQHLASIERPVSMDDFAKLGATTKATRFLIWGDSHALAAAGEIDRIAKQANQSARIAARGGIPPLLGTRRLTGAFIDQGLTPRF